MMHKQDNISLIVKNLLQEANQKEAETLQNLKNTDEDFSSLHDDMSQIWDIAGNYTPNVAIDTQSAFDKFAANYDLPIDRPNAKQNHVKQYIAYAIALLLIIISSFVIFNNVSSTSTIKGGDGSNYAVPVANYENFGDVDKLVLSPNSQILIDNDDNSILNVDGNAYFEISKKSEIKLGDAKVGAQNSAFSVSNFEDNNEYMLSVKSGKLDFALDGKVYEAPSGHSLLVDKSNGSVELTETKGNLANNITWVDGKLIFIEAYLDDVFSDVEKYFGVNIEIEGSIPNNGRFELNSPYNPISSADELFTLMDQVEVNFSWDKTDNKNYIVRSTEWK